MAFTKIMAMESKGGNWTWHVDFEGGKVSGFLDSHGVVPDKAAARQQVTVLLNDLHNRDNKIVVAADAEVIINEYKEESWE